MRLSEQITNSAHHITEFYGVKMLVIMASQWRQWRRIWTKKGPRERSFLLPVTDYAG